MAFTAADVKNLREMTGVGMMDCKKALPACAGDIAKALEYLREKGLAASAKKAGRIAAEGMAYATVCEKCGVGAVVEVNCETDFCAKSAPFVQFVKDICQGVLQDNPADVEAIKECKYPGTDLKVSEVLPEKVMSIGENLQIRRFHRFDKNTSVSYVHAGGKIGVLVNLDVEGGIDATTIGKDIAMQVAAANPGYVDEASVPAEVVAKEKEIMLAQIAGDPKTANKPEAVKQKMIEGKIKKFFKENCLVDQEFVKDGDLSVAQYTAKVAKDLGGDIKIVKFTRFQKGEGLEKRADDFAAEVASMVK